MIDTQPKICNICGGKVIYTSNAAIYHGRQYGSGYCYLCLNCRAYVGTHVPRPREAFGLLADEPMRKGKMMCHALFDPMWQGKKNARHPLFVEDIRANVKGYETLYRIAQNSR